MNKVVGKVTEEEKRSIMEINNHKNSLEELLIILPSDGELYKQASADFAETQKKYLEWWNVHYQKYQWEKGKGDWTIIFESNEIVIEV